jgi:hypothetical protein
MAAMREFFKRRFIGFLKRIFDSDLFREETRRMLAELDWERRIRDAVAYRHCYADYPELGRPEFPSTRDRSDLVFITSRFRSGSTFLWNVFRNIPGCTAYYEPFLNEKPAERGKARRGRVDPTHRGVRDYHAEIKAVTGLDAVHRDDWSIRRLYMDAYSFDPEMEQFLDRLIEQSPGRPVLQFNRIDFRLQWLRDRYPNAQILHLYRNPRNLWVSMIQNDGWVSPDYRLGAEAVRPEINAFYLWYWWHDLQFLMPFLQISRLDHPYQIHYLLWRMSYLFGKQYAHVSIRYESLVESFESVMGEILGRLGFSSAEVDRLSRLKSPPSKGDAWPRYADASWFLNMEEKAEALLSSFFNVAAPHQTEAAADEPSGEM